MTVNGQRMSKALGTVIDPIDALERIRELPAHKADPLRLYLAKEVTFGGDGDFSWERYELRYNVDLANNFGNLVSRVSTMVDRYLGGRVSPAASDGVLPSVAAEVCRSYRSAMDALAIHEGAAAAFRLIDATNGFIADTAPWTLAKLPENRERLAGVLFDAAEAVRLSAVLLRPFMPGSTLDVLRRFGASDEDSPLARERRWLSEGSRTIAVGPPVWPRSEKSETTPNVGPKTGQKDAAVDAPTPAPPPTPPVAPATVAPEAEKISIDDFMKVELRTAKVLTAERVPKSSRLLKLLVDTGSGERTIVAGLAESYEPEAIVGRTVVIVFNLKPAKLMGIESNGMVLAASPDGGKATLVSFEEPPAPGTRVR
jgi:methionyl-tRNA synthetase